MDSEKEFVTAYNTTLPGWLLPYIANLRSGVFDDEGKGHDRRLLYSLHRNVPSDRKNMAFGLLALNSVVFSSERVTPYHGADPF